MTSVSTILILLAAVTALAITARRARLPYPAVMVVGGLLIAWIPGLPRLALSPEVFFTLFLPPLLYSAAWKTSWRDFRQNLRPILLLGIGFVVFTTIVVADMAHWFVPGMTWPAAFAFGAIVSPPDAVAVTAVAGLLGIPRGIVTILEGESLVNDASGLTLYRLAVAAAVTGTFSWPAAIMIGSTAIAVGIGVGLAIGWLVIGVHKLMNDPLQETVITLLTPFAAFIVAERLHGSGVLAVVSMGLFVSRHEHEIFAPTTRLHAYSVWDTAEFVFNGLVFVLIGLQLPIVVSHFHAGTTPRGTLALWAIGAVLVVILTRICWVLPASYVTRLIFRAIGRTDPMPSWRAVFLVAYTGMRGATSLAAALALPLAVAGGAEFPRRNLIIFLTFIVILATLVLQSLTLPPIIRLLGIQPDADNQSEEWEARLRSSQAALRRVEELESAATDNATRKRTLHGLRQRYESRIKRFSAVRNGENGHAPESAVDDGVYRDVLSVERAAIVRLRDQNVIGDETLRHIFGDLDLEESRIIRLSQ